MPQTRHVERHFTAPLAVRDVVIGLADGLTVPFALAAGLTGAVAASHVVVTAGLAEIAAGAISMGLGGYLAGRTDAQHYDTERRREELEMVEKREVEMAEVGSIFRAYGLSAAESAPIVEAVFRRPDRAVDFMMRFELGLEKPRSDRALISAVTIGGAYAVGGFVPLFPYLLISDTHSALTLSIVVTLLALFTFGVVKARYTGGHHLRGGLFTVLVGGVAAGAAFGLARLVA